MFTPSTVLKLLENVDIDSDYTNTFTFSSVLEQTTFFTGKAFNTFTDFTYMRKERSVRVPNNIESMWHLSYMMFQNANYGTKWFYAFITDMKYVNDHTTEIFFEIDVMQTWYFDMEINDCYVEREHVSSDLVGAHLVDENLNIGDYVLESLERVTEIEDLSIIASTSANDTGDDILGGIFAGVYSGNGFYCTTSRTEMNSFIEGLSTLGKADAINNIFMFPTALLPISSTFMMVASASPQTLSKAIGKNYSIDGYTPRNKKLLCYPYNFLAISNNHGQTNIYKYEYFSDSNCNFDISSDITASPTVFMIPKNYKSCPKNYDELLTLTGYPLCNWTTDIYKIWQAQNAVSNTLNVGSSIVGLGAGLATMNPMAIASGVMGVAGSIGQFYEKSILPNPIHGNMSGSGNVSQGIQTFSIIKKTIRAEFARIIDNFFDRYGYKVNELKTPNFKTRVNWNYLKCHESNISGNIPSKDLSKIHSIFNAGITFWHNDAVGKYTGRDNSPI